LIGRIQIEPHDVAHFFVEMRIVGELEPFDSMRLHVKTLPDPLHQHPRYAQSLGHSPDTPMGPIGRLGLESRIQNLLLQLLAQNAARTFPFGVPLQGLDTAAEKGGTRRVYRGPRQAELLCNGAVGRSLMRQQNDAASPRDTLCRRPRSRQHS
jgi:hypothetical protein